MNAEKQLTRQVFVAYAYGLYDKRDYRKVFAALEKAFDVKPSCGDSLLKSRLKFPVFPQTTRSIEIPVRYRDGPRILVLLTERNA